MIRFFKCSVLLPIVLGLGIGGLLFAVGALDDAPGMCAIGLSIGFVLIMLGVNKSGIIPKGLLLPILLLCFGVFVALITTAILLDGEFEDKPWLSMIGFAVSVILLFAGSLRLKVFRKMSR